MRYPWKQQTDLEEKPVSQRLLTTQLVFPMGLIVPSFTFCSNTPYVRSFPCGYKNNVGDVLGWGNDLSRGFIRSSSRVRHSTCLDRTRRQWEHEEEGAVHLMVVRNQKAQKGQDKTLKGTPLVFHLKHGSTSPSFQTPQNGSTQLGMKCSAHEWGQGCVLYPNHSTWHFLSPFPLSFSRANS